MSYIKNLQRAFNVLIFKEESVKELANDPKGTGHGFLTLFLIGIISGLIAFAINPIFGIISIMVSPIKTIVGFIIGYSIYHFLAKIFGGKSTGSQYFRVMSNVMIIEVLVSAFNGIPMLSSILSFVLMFYLIAVNSFTLNKVHELSWTKAIIVALLPIVLLGVAIIGILAYYGVLSPEALLTPR